jgi:hypothetical protein
MTMSRRKENSVSVALAISAALAGCQSGLPTRVSIQESPTPISSPSPLSRPTETLTPKPTPTTELTPIEEVVPGSEVSIFFPPAFYRETKGGTLKIGEVTINVPLSLGLTKKLSEREKYPISGFELNTEDDTALNALAMLYFKDFYEIYKDQKKSPDLTLEEYAKLVANGEGKIRVYVVDEVTATDKYDRDEYEVSITQGLELLGGDVGEFSAHTSQATYYIGINEEGNLVLGMQIDRSAWTQHWMFSFEDSPSYALAADNSGEFIPDQEWYIDNMKEYGSVLEQGHRIMIVNK